MNLAHSPTEISRKIGLGDQSELVKSVSFACDYPHFPCGSCIGNCGWEWTAKSVSVNDIPKVLRSPDASLRCG